MGLSDFCIFVYVEDRMSMQYWGIGTLMYLYCIFYRGDRHLNMRIFKFQDGASPRLHMQSQIMKETPRRSTVTSSSNEISKKNLLGNKSGDKEGRRSSTRPLYPSGQILKDVASSSDICFIFKIHDCIPLHVPVEQAS